MKAEKQRALRATPEGKAAAAKASRKSYWKKKLAEEGLNGWTCPTDTDCRVCKGAHKAGLKRHVRAA
jgi:hypothetical protein